jgi:hypothetical protein
MVVNVVLRLLPIDVAPAIIATEMSEAIRAYSMAVAPASSLAKSLRNRIADCLLLKNSHSFGGKILPAGLQSLKLYQKTPLHSYVLALLISVRR